MRTQQEIKERFEKNEDLFGTQRSDLIEFMNLETAKLYLKGDYLAKVEAGEEIWGAKSDARKEILDYLDFAYEKAENERGLSAARSLLHMKTWIWLDDQVFYDEVIDLIEDYTDYGLPALDKIAQHYGFVRATENQSNSNELLGAQGTSLI